MEDIRNAQRILKNIEAAIDHALDSMPDDSLIRPFIIANRAEVKRMFITEYDEAATMEKFKKEYLPIKSSTFPLKNPPFASNVTV